MTKNLGSNQRISRTKLQQDEIIDLRQILKALSRHKGLILKVSTAIFAVSCLYTFTRKPVWEGRFEIVLASSQSSSSPAGQLLQNNPGLINLIDGVSDSNKQLKTEVRILKSPSVLKPVFDFVKHQKQQQGVNIRDLRYEIWLQENLTIELVKGTSVLELSYRDTDKKLVLPAIQKISDAYQDYSGRDRERGINQGIKYLDEQIRVFNAKSSGSLRAAQKYGIEQNLTNLQAEGINDTEINIEAIRIKSANKIRTIDEQLKQLNRLAKSSETLMYIGRNIPELSDQMVSKNFDALDVEIALLRSKYTDNDESIRRLISERQFLIEVLKQQAYGYLYAQRSAAEARLKAAERPKGVLIKYRELLRTAARDEETLNRLESKRQMLALEQARKKDPWELISTPTLLDKPVAPHRKRMVVLSLVGGIALGCGAALLVDRRTNLVYSEDELKALLPFPLVKHLSAINQKSWNDAIALLAAGPLSKIDGNSPIALIPIGNISSNQLQHFGAELKQALQGRELIISSDLLKTSRCATQLLITSLGVATRTQISELCQKLDLQGTPVSGWIFLDPELDL